MSKITARIIRGGNFKQGGELRSALLAALGPHIKRAALTVQAGIMQATPVKTGNLRRSWNTGDPRWEGTRLSTKVGTPVVYARSVEERGKSKGYVRRGLTASQSRALAELREGARSIGANVWKKG